VTILSVVCDSREPQWAKNLKFGGVPVAIQTLDAGDYWVATNDNKILIIERKTADDFVGSIIDGRIFHQVANMQTLRDQGYWSYVMITSAIQRNSDGTVFTTLDRKFSWNAVQGAKLSIQELGIPIIECGGDTDFEDAIMRLAERSRDDFVRIAPARKPRFFGGGATLLLGLPGIGLETVDRVLEYCGTAAWALSEFSDLESKLKIPGIGPGMKANVRWALGLKDDELLIVANKTILEDEGA
jgi:ERCC4-type nuclease